MGAERRRTVGQRPRAGQDERSNEGNGRAASQVEHFATFPPALIEPCILAGSRPGDMVLDPFGGSGTTAGVALKHGRHAMLCELNEEYAALVPARVDNVMGMK